MVRIRSEERDPLVHEEQHKHLKSVLWFHAKLNASSVSLQHTSVSIWTAGHVIRTVNTNRLIEGKHIFNGTLFKRRL